MPRVIFDLPQEFQMAIKLRAVKSDTTHGEVIAEAVGNTFGDDLAEAIQVLNSGRAALNGPGM